MTSAMQMSPSARRSLSCIDSAWAIPGVRPRYHAVIAMYGRDISRPYIEFYGVNEACPRPRSGRV